MGALPETKMNVEEFFSWCEEQKDDARYELVDGRVVAMGRDRQRHNRAKVRAFDALRNAIGISNVECEAFIDGMGVSGDEFNFRIPDALVHCGAADDEDSSTVSNPVIVVEVVSPTSEERDVHAKLHDYFSVSSVFHYLIVYDQRKYVVHHEREEGGTISTTFVSSGNLDLAPPGLVISASDLFGEEN